MAKTPDALSLAATSRTPVDLRKDDGPKGPPLVIVRDMQTHDAADLPDEALQELIRIVGHT